MCVCVCDNMQKMQCASGSRLYQSPLAAKSGVPEISQKLFNSATPKRSGWARVYCSLKIHTD